MNDKLVGIRKSFETVKSLYEEAKAQGNTRAMEIHAAEVSGMKYVLAYIPGQEFRELSQQLHQFTLEHLKGKSNG